MEQFFDTIYLYTSGLYGQELDNYLYETVPGLPSYRPYYVSVNCCHSHSFLLHV